MGWPDLFKSRGSGLFRLSAGAYRSREIYGSGDTRKLHSLYYGLILYTRETCIDT